MPRGGSPLGRPFGTVIQREQAADLGDAFELVAGAVRRRDRREDDLVEESGHRLAGLVGVRLQGFAEPPDGVQRRVDDPRERILDHLGGLPWRR